MSETNTIVTRSNSPLEGVHLANIPDGYSPVTVILSIAVLISAISKLIQVLVPVMMKDQNRQ